MDKYRENMEINEYSEDSNQSDVIFVPNPTEETKETVWLDGEDSCDSRNHHSEMSENSNFMTDYAEPLDFDLCSDPHDIARLQFALKTDRFKYAVIGFIYRTLQKTGELSTNFFKELVAYLSDESCDVSYFQYLFPFIKESNKMEEITVDLLLEKSEDFDSESFKKAAEQLTKISKYFQKRYPYPD